MSMIGVDYGVLNQRGSPSWFSDIYANIPTAGYKGRMFISTDTFAFYRDTGTGWDLIGGPGTGTITGSGASGQVSYFNGSSTLAGSNNLFWDNTNGRLGIGTATPSAALDIHATGTNAQFNGTGTNNATLVFQNAGSSKWSIGNVYGAGSNTFRIYNNITSASALTIDNTTNAISSEGTGSYGGVISLKQGSLTSAGTGYTTLASKSAGQLLIYFGDTNLYGATILNTSLTASRSYTLPDANGTLALTSNIPANIVTGTGVSNQVAYWSGTSTQTGSNNFLFDNTNGTLTFLGLNSSQFAFSNGKFSSTRTSAAINLTFSAENRQTPAADVGSSYGFYGGTSGNNTIAEMKAAWEGSSINNSYFSILTTLSGSSNEKLRITSAGYVGINTTTPSYFLDVNGNARLTGSLLIDNGLGTNQIYLPKSSGDVYGTIQTQVGGNKFSLGNVSAIGTLGTPNITWTSGALVGINNVSPSYELDVTGSLRSTTTSYLATTSGNVGIGTITSVDYPLTIKTNTSANSLKILARSSGDSSVSWNSSDNITQYAHIDIGSSYFQIYASNSQPLQFFLGGTEKARITSGGNLLIGTTTDGGQKLQVTGQIRSTGAMNLNTSDIVYATGTTTIFTITSEVNSHYLVVGHDPNSTGIYASAIVIVNGTGGISNVISLGSAGGLTITGTGTTVQMINVGAAANGRNSIIRMR